MKWFFIPFLFCLNLFATALTVTTVSETDVQVGDSVAAYATSNSFANTNGDVMLMIRNDDSSNSATVTFTPADAAVTIPGFGSLTKSAITVTVAASTTRIIGPFPKTVWNDTGSNSVEFSTAGAGSTAVRVWPFRWDPSNQ